MSHFADSLLTALLSWMRSLFSVFIRSMQGNGSGFLSWMKSRWFVLAAILCLAGVALDILIYLFRWRPQDVWRSRLNALQRRDSRAEAEFSQGYESGLPDFDFVDTPIDGFAPAPMEALADLEPPLPESQEALDINLPGAEEEFVQRRRRSARHSRRKRRIHIRLPELTERDEGAYVPPVRASEAFHAPVYPAMDETPPEDASDV